MGTTFRFSATSDRWEEPFPKKKGKHRLTRAKKIGKLPVKLYQGAELALK